MKIKTHITGLAVVLVMLFVCFFITGAEAAEAWNFEPLLSWTGAAESTMTVTWRMPETEKTSYIRFGTTDTLENALRVEASAASMKSGINPSFSSFSAVLSGLKPDTEYYYSVGGTSGRSGVMSFKTAGAKEESTSFIYMGDIQVVSDAEKEYAAWGEMLGTAYEKNPGLAFGLLGGDIVENGTKAGEWEAFIKNASPVFSKIPLMPTNGNHESNFLSGKPELYTDMFTLPQNGPEGFKEEFYSFNRGSCHIAVLNSWVFSGEQKLSDAEFSKISQWIENDLSASSATWKIVVMHNPAYSLASDKVSDAVRKNWAPLFEKCGVSLVFCGHQHVYSRSYPMLAAEIDNDNGIVYIMGNSGQKYYSSADERYSEKTIYQTSTYQLVSVSGDKLTVQTFDSGGNELDYCALSPRQSKKPSFSDVRDADSVAIGKVSKSGLFSGVGNNTFLPDAPMTRAMLVTVLGRMSGVTPKAGVRTGFHDVPEGLWYSGYVSWAEQNGLAKGISSFCFEPERALTREEAAVLLYRYASLTGENISSSFEGAGYDSYTDSGDISAWAEKAVKWAVDIGVMSCADFRINPRGGVTRAQTAEMIDGYSNLYLTEAGK